MIHLIIVKLHNLHFIPLILLLRNLLFVVFLCFNLLKTTYFYLIEIINH